MKKNKFRILVLTIIICAFTIPVLTQVPESDAIRQQKVEKTDNQSKANQIFQSEKFDKSKFDKFKTSYFNHNNKSLQLFAFERPNPISTLQGEEIEMMDKPPIDWNCYLACRAAFPDMHPLVCMAACWLN